MLRNLLIALTLAVQPALAETYLVFPPGKDRTGEIWTGKAPVQGINVPAESIVRLWIPSEDESGNIDVNPNNYINYGAIKGIKRVPPETPPLAVAPDFSGFLDEVVQSGLFSNDDILQILVVSRLTEKDQRDKMTLLFLSQTSPEKQSALADIASRHAIELPQGGK